jgi:hypothetical protein
MVALCPERYLCWYGLSPYHFCIERASQVAQPTDTRHTLSRADRFVAGNRLFTQGALPAILASYNRRHAGFVAAERAEKEEWQGEVTDIALTCNLATKVRLLQWSNRRRLACRGTRTGPGMSHAVSLMLAVQTDHRRASAPATRKARVTSTRHLRRLCKDYLFDCKSWRWLRAIFATVVHDHLVQGRRR